MASQAIPQSGLRIIADVHGCANAFAAAAEPARTAGRFVLQLGDLVDRGPDSPACIRQALRLVKGQGGQFLRGNHDDKLARLLLGNPVKVPVDLAHTVTHIDAAPDAASLRKDFLVAWRDAPWWLHFGSFVFVHGAFHPAMLDHTRPEAISPGRIRRKVEYLALHGESILAVAEALPERTYGWVETIPAGVTVVVGHDVRSETSPTVSTNVNGGRAVFLDTGCGKGGRLSWLDLEPGGQESIVTLEEATS